MRDEMTRHLLLAGSRGAVALMLLFLSNYPGAFAAVLFFRAMKGGEFAEANVVVGLLLVLGIPGWRRFVLSLLSDAFYERFLGIKDVPR